jgi:hypothetical protein
MTHVDLPLMQEAIEWAGITKAQTKHSASANSPNVSEAAGEESGAQTQTALDPANNSGRIPSKKTCNDSADRDKALAIAH